LSAFFSDDGCTATQSIGEALELACDGDFASAGEEIIAQEDVEDIESGAALAIAERKKALKGAYPFEISKDGRIVSYDDTLKSYGPAAYLISLVLSNLRALTPMLTESGRHPNNSEVAFLRVCFQHFAAAALAAEIGGRAWSFGFPRPDGSGFLPKLKEIWGVLKDGTVGPEVGEVPSKPKDDGIDALACRPHVDGLPGFLLAVAQVATGANWQEKSLRGHLDHVFFQDGSRGSRQRHHCPITLFLSLCPRRDSVTTCGLSAMCCTGCGCRSGWKRPQNSTSRVSRSRRTTNSGKLWTGSAGLLHGSRIREAPVLLHMPLLCDVPGGVC